MVVEGGLKGWIVCLDDKKQVPRLNFTSWTQWLWTDPVMNFKWYSKCDIQMFMLSLKNRSEFYSNAFYSYSCPDISLWTKNVNLPVVQEEKSGGHQSE